MVCQPGTLPEMCTYEPSFDVDLYVETNIISLAAIINARSTIEREIEVGALFVSGDQRLARTMDRWMPKTYYADIEGIAPLR
jgi:hypothetical protein